MSEIEDMTVDQMQLYLKAYTKKTLLDKIDKVTLEAVASQGDNKAISKSVKNLQDVISKIDR